jgi:hypothetical protein
MTDDPIRARGARLLEATPPTCRCSLRRAPAPGRCCGCSLRAQEGRRSRIRKLIEIDASETEAIRVPAKRGAAVRRHGRVVPGLMARGREADREIDEQRSRDLAELVQSLMKMRTLNRRQPASIDRGRMTPPSGVTETELTATRSIDTATRNARVAVNGTQDARAESGFVVPTRSACETRAGTEREARAKRSPCPTTCATRSPSASSAQRGSPFDGDMTRPENLYGDFAPKRSSRGRRPSRRSGGSSPPRRRSRRMITPSRFAART